MTQTTKLLFDEEPLVVQPSLAKLIGLNEAIIVQQLHYWLRKSNHHHDGRNWVYNTYDDWCKQFPFWGKRTLERLIPEMEKDGLIITGNYNKAKFDKTKWYTLDYDLLEHRLRKSVDDTAKVAKRKRQGEDSHTAKVAASSTWVGGVQAASVASTIPENNQRITSESTREETPTPTPAHGAQKVWLKCLDKLKDRIDQAKFAAWLATSQAIGYEGNAMLVNAKNQFAVDWVLPEYVPLIDEALGEIVKELGRDATLQVRFVHIEIEGGAESE